jgi:transcription-repair coupling factor (superfamily II helicase)
MGEGELEKAMLAFMNGEYDVLCATSIIENGLDISRANTIIINRADRHGLSELYQLRGRVGRSDRRAYAYLLIPPENELTEIARRRLAALKEFSDLGAGFKIAALDLELRGAGNMLGGEQSGHIEAIGFEMYTSMLQEAVSKIKGESQEERPGVQLNLGISLRIDATYIPEENQRLRMYKRIAGATDTGVLVDVRAEMIDRYGELPESVVNLLAAAEVRLQCERLCIAQLDRKRLQLEENRQKVFREMLIIKFDQKAKIDPGMLMKMVSRNTKKGAQFTPQGVLRWPLPNANSADVIAETKALLEQLDLTPVTA